MTTRMELADFCERSIDADDSTENLLVVYGLLFIAEHFDDEMLYCNTNEGLMLQVRSMLDE